MSEQQRRLVLLGFGIFGIFILILLVVSFLPSAPKVVNTSPISETQNLDPTSTVTFAFDKSVDLSKISYQIAPTIKLTKSLSSDPKFVYLKPDPSFSKNTDYQLELFYDQKSLAKLTFRTASASQSSQELTQIKNRLTAQMPIDNENYSIEFLSATDEFLVTVKKNPYEENKSRVEAWFKEQGLKNLTDLNIVFYQARWIE